MIFSSLFSVGHVNIFMVCQRKCNAGTCSQFEENPERKKRKNVFNHISHYANDDNYGDGVRM